MTMRFEALLIGLLSALIASSAADLREIPLLVTDTLGNPVKHYRVEVTPAYKPSQMSFETPGSLKLPLGRIDLKVLASLHRSVTQQIDVTPTLEVIMIGLVRPTGSEVVGDGSPANPSIRISVGPIDLGNVPTVLRVVSLYSSYSRNVLVVDGRGEVQLIDLPFGEYRVFLFENGKVTREFELFNEDLKSVVLKPLPR